MLQVLQNCCKCCHDFARLSKLLQVLQNCCECCKFWKFCNNVAKVAKMLQVLQNWCNMGGTSALSLRVYTLNSGRVVSRRPVGLLFPPGSQLYLCIAKPKGQVQRTLRLALFPSFPTTHLTPPNHPNHPTTQNIF